MTTWDTGNAGTGLAFSNGNRTVTHPNTSGTWLCVLANTSKSTGKFYWEILLGALPNDGSVNGGNMQLGFCKNDQTVNGYVGQTGNDGWVRADMATYDGGHEGVVSYTTGNRGFTTAVATDVIGFAIDLDAGKLWVSKNNTFGGSPGAGTNPAFTWTPGGNWYPVWGCFNGGYSNDPAGTLRPAAADQSYAAPSGFSAWDAAASSWLPEDFQRRAFYSPKKLLQFDDFPTAVPVAPPTFTNGWQKGFEPLSARPRNVLADQGNIVQPLSTLVNGWQKGFEPPPLLRARPAVNASQDIIVPPVASNSIVHGWISWSSPAKPPLTFLYDFPGTIGIVLAPPEGWQGKPDAVASRKIRPAGFSEWPVATPVAPPTFVNGWQKGLGFESFPIRPPVRPAVVESTIVPVAQVAATVYPEGWGGPFALWPRTRSNISQLELASLVARAAEVARGWEGAFDQWSGPRRRSTMTADFGGFSIRAGFLAFWAVNANSIIQPGPDR